MKERPILFSAPMVKAILAGKKTQTRRLVRVQPNAIVGDLLGQPRWYVDADPDKAIVCPHGKPADRLWVRETWDFRSMSASKTIVRIAYAADGAQADMMAPAGWNPTIYNTERWRPSIHMPRWASRLDLEITEVRCERLQDITEEDACAEGVVPPPGCPYAKTAFADLWEQINGDRAPWASNPWVWAISFKRVKK